MLKKNLMLMLVFSLSFNAMLVFPFSLKGFHFGQSYANQQDDLHVHNLNTSKSYSTIQKAIDAPETLEGDTIFVASGVYYEHVKVHKSLRLIGEDQSTTVIDGNGKDRIIYVTADNVEVRSFSIRNGTFGLWFDNSSNSKIIDNKLQYGSYGIRLYHSRNSEIIGNNIHGYTLFGVDIESSGNSTLRDNNMVDNKYNFGVDGNSLSDFINDIDVSNTINNKPIYYMINQHNITFDSSTFQEIGYLSVVNSTNVRVENLDVHGNKQGILFAFAANSTISNVNARNNWNGIYIAHSSDISINRNNANSNFDYGIKFFNSSRSRARENDVDNNGWAGIGLFRSNNSTVDRNSANFNTYNIHVVYTNNSVISRNIALIRRGSYSIAVYYSHNNVIYHNTFDSSLLFVESRNGTRFIPRNNWDNELEGNYWSFFRGFDENKDGIGDAPYVVEENNVDNHPLMGWFSYFTVIFGEKNYSIAIISNSTVSKFQFSFDNTQISYLATGTNDTEGFSRISIPNAFLQDLGSDNLSVLINEEEPVLNRKWTNGTHLYFYFSYVNKATEPSISPWPILVLVSVFSIISVLVFLGLKKKSRTRSRLYQEQVSNLR